MFLCHPLDVITREAITRDGMSIEQESLLLAKEKRWRLYVTIAILSIANL